MKLFLMFIAGLAVLLASLLLSWQPTQERPARASSLPLNEAKSSPVTNRITGLQPVPVAIQSDSMQTETSPAPDSVSKTLSTPYPDEIDNEYIFSFFSAADRNRFLALAESLGIEILDRLELGYSVRLRADNQSRIDRLLRDAPLPVARGKNIRLRIPPVPEALTPRARQAGYRPFGSGALDWLGVSGSHSDWGRGVTIAILDTAVSRHPSLPESRIRRVNPFQPDASGTSGYHGTAVASLIVGNGEGALGIAPAAQVLSIPVVDGNGSGDAFTLASGIVEAVSLGADIINISLASSGDSYLVREAVQFARKNGVVIVASSGNDAVDAVSYPARYADVIAVGGVDAQGRHLYFSNSGAAVDITAPGIGLDAAGPGESYIMFSGTSAAAPLVSGAIAAVMSQSNNLDPTSAAALLSEFADDFGAPGTDSFFGGGILNVDRLMNRNLSGIYDMSAGLPHVVQQPGESGELVVDFYAQNRGTEPVASAELIITIDGSVFTKHYQDVTVGETVSERMIIPVAGVASGTVIRVSHEIKVPGVVDISPRDNGRRAVLEIFRSAPTP